MLTYRDVTHLLVGDFDASPVRPFFSVVDKGLKTNVVRIEEGMTVGKFMKTWNGFGIYRSNSFWNLKTFVNLVNGSSKEKQDYSMFDGVTKDTVLDCEDILVTTPDPLWSVNGLYGNIDFIVKNSLSNKWFYCYKIKDC